MALFLGASLALTGIGAARAEDVTANRAAIDQILQRDYPRLEALYRDIHAHPELAYQESATARKLAAELRGLGVVVTEGVGGTGIVGVLKNGPGPVVLIRTELDALPMEEKTGLPYASRVQQTYKGQPTFVDHACGHDIHMAAWIGVARVLTDLKSKWSGTIVFVGQPAEEALSGAKTMLQDGLLTRFPKPDVGFALHVTPAPYGTVGYGAGVISSAADTMNLIFVGRGGHGATPATTIDPVLMSARFVVDLQSVISREKDPAAPGVVTIGSIRSGSAPNIIPDSAELHGTVRTFDPKVRAKIIDGIQRTALGVTTIAGAPPPQLEFVEHADAVVNDAALTAKVAVVFKTAFGDRAIEARGPGTASEDYSAFILAGVPSMYFTIGGSDPKAIIEASAKGTQVPANHSPFFAPVPEPSIKTGVEAMSLAVLSVVGH